MNITVEKQSADKTVRIFGDINRFELTSLKREFLELETVRQFIIDLSEAEFAGTDFLNLLAEIRNKLPKHFSKVILRYPNELILDLLQLSQMDKVFKLELAPVSNMANPVMA